MIWDVIQGSNDRGELILVDGGYCRFHIQEAAMLQIYEIVIQNSKAFERILEILKKKHCYGITVSYPDHGILTMIFPLYGFKMIGTRTTKKQDVIATWVLESNSHG